MWWIQEGIPVERVHGSHKTSPRPTEVRSAACLTTAGSGWLESAIHSNIERTSTYETGIGRLSCICILQATDAFRRASSSVTPPAASAQ